MENEYTDDARHWLNRASNRIKKTMNGDELFDSVLFFAFGVEKLFKAVLWDVNPMFVYEKASFDQAILILYRDRLTESEREKATKEAENKKNLELDRVHTFQKSMFNAAKFSEEIGKNVGKLTQLSDYRGHLAHRPAKGLDQKEMLRFVHRWFHPIVSEIASSAGLDEKDVFGGHANALKGMSVGVIRVEKKEEGFEKLREEHFKIWESREGDKEFVKKARRSTDDQTGQNENEDYTVYQVGCPACGNSGLMIAQLEYEYSGSWARPTGVGNAGFECHFCDLELYDYEAFDYFGFQDDLAEFIRD